MDPVGKALWFIESHFAEDISLGEIATVAGVSRYHVTRAFGEATGLSVMRYVRGRRLSEAAKALIDGAPDILSVALDAGYGSHEAFTRAFKQHFGLTPEQARAPHMTNLKLQEPMKMPNTAVAHIAPARIDKRDAMLVFGLSQHYTPQTMSEIPS